LKESMSFDPGEVGINPDEDDMKTLNNKRETEFI